MASQHPDKRIKLFVERSIERLPFDITQKAEEIYLPDGDPAEKLKRKIKTIADIAGDNYDQYTENVSSASDSKRSDNDDSAQAATEQDKAVSTTAVATIAPSAAAAAAANTRITSPQAIYAKLWHAQSEIGLALDVLNIIISSYQMNNGPGGGNISSGGMIGSGGGAGTMSTLTNNNAPPTALPPGSLKCEYVPRTPQTLSALISNEKMALGGKKHQLRNAADILMQGATKLKKVMADESQFWQGALTLRKNNWCIVSGRTGAGQQQLLHHHHVSRIANGSQLFVQYGFRDVGSLFGERAYAELVRNQSSLDSETGRAKSIELHIPNKTGKLINEARTMSNSVSIVDNEIFLPINDELELKIAYRTPTAAEKDATLSSTRIKRDKSDLSRNLEGTAEILRCAMQLMQHRRHRQNIKERSDSFFKSSRPGAGGVGSGGVGRTAGMFGQIQQTLQQRPSVMLSMTLQALQYYSFSRRIREALGKVTRNIRQSWWEPVSVHSVDLKSPPVSSGSSTAQISSTVATIASPSLSTAGSTAILNNGMGLAVSVHLGSHAPAVRFVMRSHPAPCVVLQSSDRPPVPVMHVAEFERMLEQELAVRAIGRICQVVNSIHQWSESLQSPKFVIDIDRRCVGVFQVSQKNGTAHGRTAQM
ncbi:hypothetical protein BGZ99_000684 [Dissophora globulifera]|uniref:Mediator of RNA polymerase II transcription subunit 17 n=1 Tax=Dissophora globulifera TaxID=979702 RepID=A0A9P6R2J4_9FUNG|nr:hypothetical protein BGZ99_000684 [Dissophora globulifera]